MKSLLAIALLVAGLQTATTKSKTTRLRAEPKNGAPIVATVPQGTTLQIIGAEEPYLKVEYEGQTAYVHRGFINMTPVLERALAGEVETAVGLPEEGEIRLSLVSKNTVIREQPTGASKSLARLDDGETVRIVAKAEGDFWEVQYGDVRGFVHDLLLQKDVPETSGPDESIQEGPIPVEETSGFGGGAYRMRMRSGITPPAVLKQVRPHYTDEALTKKVQGEVILEVVILSVGKIGPVRVLRGLSAGLTERAIECVRQWVFVPGKLKGQPVDVIAEIVVEFSILEKPK